MIEVMRYLLWSTLLVVGASLVTSSAFAHGRTPVLGRIAFHPTDPDVIFIRGTFGVVVSDDGGATFEWICPTAYGGRWTEDPAITVAQDGSLIVGVFNGLARGTQGGCEWDYPSVDLMREVVIDVDRTRNGSRLFAIQSSGGSDNGLWTSTDSGATWAAANPAIDPILFETVRVAPSSSTRVYLTGAYPPSVDMPRRPFVYASDDGGMTFGSVAFTDFRTEDRNVYLLGVDPLDPDRLLILVRSSLDDRIYESTDAGLTFDEIYTMPTVDAFAWSDDGATVWLGTSTARELHRSTDGGGTFEVMRDDLAVSCLGARGDELFVCANNFGDGFALGKSTDGGMSIDPIFVFDDIGGIVDCSPGAFTPGICIDELEDLERDLGLVVADGGVPDGGADAAVPGDGGASDGALPGDASPDATDSSRRDMFPPPDSDGCSCRVQPRRGSEAGWLGIASVLLLARRRWRRDRRR